MGAALSVTLRSHGFYPAGGGVLHAAIGQAVWRHCELLDRLAEPQLRARIAVARIPLHVAEREAAVLRRDLGLRADEIAIESVDSAGPGNVVVLRVGLGPVTEVITALGERGVPAQTVAGKVVTTARELLAANVPVGEHLADQLLIPMALAGGGAFVTVEPTLHTRTNAQIIEMFLPVRFEFRPEGGGSARWHVLVRARS